MHITLRYHFVHRVKGLEDAIGNLTLIFSDFHSNVNICLYNIKIAMYFVQNNVCIKLLSGRIHHDSRKIIMPSFLFNNWETKLAMFHIYNGMQKRLHIFSMYLKKKDFRHNLNLNNKLNNSDLHTNGGHIET